MADEQVKLFTATVVARMTVPKEANENGAAPDSTIGDERLPHAAFYSVSPQVDFEANTFGGYILNDGATANTHVFKLDGPGNKTDVGEVVSGEGQSYKQDSSALYPTGNRLFCMITCHSPLFPDGTKELTVEIVDLGAIFVAYPNGDLPKDKAGAFLPGGEDLSGPVDLTDAALAAIETKVTAALTAYRPTERQDIQSKAADALVEVLNRANHDTDPKAKEVLDALYSLVGDDIWTDLNKVWSGQEQPSGKNASQMYQEFLAAVRAGR